MTDVHLLEPVDGRSARGQRSRAAILEACREFMRAGRFRPSAVDVARLAGCATRTVFMHFRDIEDLHLRAIEDSGTRDAIYQRVAGSTSSIVRGVVLGRGL